MCQANLSARQPTFMPRLCLFWRLKPAVLPTVGIFGAGIEPGDPAISLPKFYVVTVDKLLSGFNCSVIVGTVERNGFREMAVMSNNVGSIVRHVCTLMDQAGQHSQSPVEAERGR
jgi:hypothetical protein